MIRRVRAAAAGLAAIAATFAMAGAASAVECPVKLGAVLPVSGPMGQVGERIAQTGQFAVELFNEAGGVKGCPVEYVLRDTQGQPTVGVDAAKSLVELEGVPALVGAISSGVSLPILTSVAVPSKVVQISCCSSSETFTQLAKEGKTDGLWFRTYATNRSQSAMAALLATKAGFKKTAVIYVNTDFGVGLANRFKEDVVKLGGGLGEVVAYNESQQSYRAEVTKALQGNPDSLFLIAFPVDGATITREWLALGGTDNLIVNNSLRSDDYFDAVGRQYLKNLIGYDSAQPRLPSVATFNELFEKRFDSPPNGPGLHSVFDAVTVTLLAMEQADELTGPAIRDAIRAVTKEGGTEVHPGPDGIRRAKELIAAGKPIRYVGATGALSFDENGDVQAPKMVWKLIDGKNTEVEYYSTEDIARLIAKLDN
ncbi:MAG: ABC transporter substrate-binding protein [Alphaproteobacteria bacterium]|nr:MAG: ABC transporter substrate-binding protein [Alphaproteobacteria bacterium]